MRLTAKHEVSLSVAMGDEKLRRTDMSETDLRRAGNICTIGVEQSEEQVHLSEAVTSMSVTKNMNEAKLSEEENPSEAQQSETNRQAKLKLELDLANEIQSLSMALCLNKLFADSEKSELNLKKSRIHK